LIVIDVHAGRKRDAWVAFSFQFVTPQFITPPGAGFAAWSSTVHSDQRRRPATWET
jgi:hypothetical protein